MVVTFSAEAVVGRDTDGKRANVFVRSERAGGDYDYDTEEKE